MIYHGKERNSLADLPAVVKRTVKTLKAALLTEDFDCIGVSGMSGVVVGVPVALALKVPCVIVRKQSDMDDSHATYSILNRDNIGKRILFLDDFVGCGGTRARVVEKVQGVSGVRVVAEYLYKDEEYNPAPRGGFSPTGGWDG
jgi:adenine/guanine phosphoribosyltransferase-like PRPP-binding protein